ncbi:MAG: YceD family protein [Woeseiaceae bacterium]
MGNPLRERRSAADLAAGAQVIEIAEKVGDFEQLSAIVEADLAALDADRMPTGWRDSAIKGSLEFGFADAQQVLPKVRCRVGVTVDAVCQRCVEAFRLPLEVDVELLLLEFEQDADGFEEFEVWELEDILLRPLDLVEELLIMALPFSAMHVDSASCKALSPPVKESAEEMTTPFAALRDHMAQDN